MTAVPVSPAIYHILHVDRLSSVIGASGLFCDITATAKNVSGTVIGMGELKAHRLTRTIDGHSGLTVGGCVPFYFCSKSVMLYVIHRANHPNLAYRGGQKPIVHLEADLHGVADWAEANNRRWAFSLGNASAGYAEFRTNRDAIGELNWTVIRGTDFSSPAHKDAKQAEFLVEDFVPWTLVYRIGVIDGPMAHRVAGVIARAKHRPQVEILRGWYY